MFCFISLWLPPPSGAFHRMEGPFRSTHQSDRASPCATFRKMKSPQTIGVAPLHSGNGNFHATLDSAVHLSGSPFSLLVPFSCGPRHWGQLSADKDAARTITNEIDSHMRFIRTAYQTGGDGGNGGNGVHNEGTE